MPTKPVRSHLSTAMAFPIQCQNPQGLSIAPYQKPRPLSLSTIKLLGALVFCFVCGMQLHHKSNLQINVSSYYSHNTFEEVSMTNGEIHSASEATADVGASEIAATIEVVRKAPDNPVERIILIGERHSGTNWITDYLAECFGDRVIVNNEYTRFKHWFQEDTLETENLAVVVAIFRDPMDWVEAMRYEPHHAHDHLHFHNKSYVKPVVRKELTEDDKSWHRIADRMQWREFVTKPWVGRRGPNDIKLAQSQAGIESAVCMDNYHFVDAAPCSIEDSPFLKGLGEYKYEYKNDGSERGFNSILDMRRDKILNHLSMADFRGTRVFLPYRYEELRANGTATLLREVEEATGLQARCDVIYGKVKDDKGRVIPAPSVRHRLLTAKKISSMRELSADYIEYMNRFVDWKVERLIGYYPREK